MTKRELEKEALDLLLREDETMDEVEYGDVERDEVQRRIQNVVAQYKELLKKQEHLDYVLDILNKVENEVGDTYSKGEQDHSDRSFNSSCFLHLWDKIQEDAAEIGYNTNTREYEG